MSKPQAVHQALIEKEQTLSLAESCTGGHLAAKLTSIPDASKYFLGSLITYSNGMKEKLLHVKSETLLQHGAVSRETANEMLLGLMKVSGADYGVAITGIAGPSGGTPEKPVGTVYVAVGAKGKKPHIVRCLFEGNRQDIVEATCERAFEELSALIGD